MREGIYPVQGVVRARSVSLRLGFGGDDFSYAIDFGLPAGSDPQSVFALDPEIKRESIWHGPPLRPAAVLCERDNGIVRIRGDRGTWSEPQAIRPYDSMLSEFADPGQAPDGRRGAPGSGPDQAQQRQEHAAHLRAALPGTIRRRGALRRAGSRHAVSAG